MRSLLAETSGGSLVFNDRSWRDKLVCPECAQPLLEVDDTLNCPDCDKAWPIIDGVPHFVEAFPYWGEIPLEQMQEVNRQAEQGYWKAALIDSPEPTVQKAREMILNLDRANWQLLLDLPAESRVLDLGAGMGTNSQALAMRYREVVALEPVHERVEFMRHRFGQEGLRNIGVLRSSLWTLPFAKETFDLVAMNGVLEWVAERQAGDPGDLQEVALNNVYRLLRPGGYLYIGIENRLSLGYFAGYPDPHCGLPWVTILPRRVADWYARRKGQKGYCNYLYSARGYCKLLRKVGFTGLEVYLALPSYNHPRFLIPMKANVFSYYCNNLEGSSINRSKKAIRWILLKSKLLQYFQYSFVILARK
jgi:SAM-dependent methyltransferase